MLLAALATLGLLATSSGVATANGGYHTSSGAMITIAGTAPAGTTALPIIDVGEDADVEGFAFEGIPDGIGVMPGAQPGTADVFVNHEQSRVPFNNQADFVDASVSRLTLNTATGGVLDAEVALDPSLGFIRFCSATMAGPAEGLSGYTFFTNEESNDVVNVPAGAPYGPDPALAPQRQAGYALALDPDTGDVSVLAGAGRHNHENDMIVPGGWDELALLSGDDTFFTPPLPDWSQLYVYLAESENQLLSDHGTLWAFRVTHTDDGRVDAANPFNGANDYGDIQTGDDWRGRFIRVPNKIARGLTGAGPQDALEDWSNAHNVFQFIRVEDTAYDVNEPRVVYITDTGDRRMIPDATTGRLTRAGSSTVGSYTNGRIFRMEFDPDNPRKVSSFSILVNADAGGFNNPSSLHQPDNIGTSEHSLMIQEDTGQAPGSRVWRYDLVTGSLTVIASVNNGLTDESSGIVDASPWGFGAGTWLMDVQAHSTFIDTDTSTPPITYKREAGQLLLLTVPGS
jgi:hypothetical protein